MLNLQKNNDYIYIKLTLIWVSFFQSLFLNKNKKQLLRNFCYVCLTSLTFHHYLIDYQNLLLNTFLFLEFCVSVYKLKDYIIFLKTILDMLCYFTK